MFLRKFGNGNVEIFGVMFMNVLDEVDGVYEFIRSRFLCRCVGYRVVMEGKDVLIFMRFSFFESLFDFFFGYYEKLVKIGNDGSDMYFWYSKGVCKF